MTSRNLLGYKNSRRDLMRLLGVGMGASAVGATGARVLAETPVAGDRPEIVVGVQALPGSLDPAVTYSNVSLRTFYSIYDYLVEYDYLSGDTPGMGGELIPGLLTEWDVIDDFTHECKIREGVTWHDGTPFTANDIKYSVARINAEDADPTLTAHRSSIFPGIEDVEVIDDLTLRFITSIPKPGLINTFAYGQAWIVPEHLVEEIGNEEFALTGMGTGPYKVAEFVPGERLVLDANDDYWGNPPAFSRVTYRTIPEDATRIAGAQTGELDLITNVPPDQMNELQNDDRFRTDSIPFANAHIYFFNTKHPHVQNKLVRQGLNRAIDRKAIIDTIWGGMADYMGSFQIPSWGDFYNPDRDAYAYDPEAAKALLEEGGYNGEEIVYSTMQGYYVLDVEVAQVIAASWQAIGVNARVQVEEQWGVTEDTMVLTWSNDLLPSEPSHTFWRIWGEGGPAQERGYWVPEDPRFNGEFGEILLSSFDHEARVEAYQGILDIWDDEAPAGILYNHHGTYLQRADLNWQPYTIYGMDFREQAVDSDE